jgi:voltage-gated potassium channel
VAVHELGAAVLLVAVTLCLQCAGMAILIRWARAFIMRSTARMNPWHSAVLMIRFTIGVIVLQFLQITVWAGFYRWTCLPSWESSLYFSATSYSTVGYGDVLLPQAWRLLGPIESVIGVLMCGMSVSGLFAILIKLLAAEDRYVA